LIWTRALFSLGGEERKLCLTFDDGPNPGSTYLIINVLKKYGVKAMFFCSGREAECNSTTVNKLTEEGHVIGNHGYFHLNGWKTGTSEYVENAIKAEQFTSTEFFRPPYGKMTMRQYRLISARYKLVMWNLMPYDFDTSLTRSEVTDILKRNARRGSVIVMHDNPTAKAWEIIDEFIPWCLENGFRFVTL
jgi:peptidoglycan-N-acetylglucosamine deacetylase